MRKSNNFFTALLAVATTIGVAFPANAQNVSDIDALINSWLRDRSVHDLAPSQAAVRANLESRRTQLDAQISAEVASGRLTAREAASLRTQLASLDMRIRSSMYGGGLTVGEVRDLLANIRTVATNISAAVSSGGPVIGGGGGGGGGSARAELRADIQNLRNQIASARASGSLRAAEANRLNDSLAWIRRELNRADNNGLTVQERARISSYIATVDARFDAMTTIASNPRFDLTNDIGNVRAQINQRLASGRITQAEARRLLRDLDHVANVQVQLRNSGGRMTQEEFNYLRRMLSAVQQGVRIYM